MGVSSLQVNEISANNCEHTEHGLLGRYFSLGSNSSKLYFYIFLVIRKLGEFIIRSNKEKGIRAVTYNL